MSRTRPDCVYDASWSQPGLLKGARAQEAPESGARDDRDRAAIGPPRPRARGVFGSFIAFGLLGRFVGPPVPVQRAFTTVAAGEPITDATEGPSGGSRLM